MQDISLGHLNSILDSWDPSFHTQAFLDPLWVCEILVLDSSNLSFVALVIPQARVIDLLLMEDAAS
jgi:hypothetical protein